MYHALIYDKTMRYIILFTLLFVAITSLSHAAEKNSLVIYLNSGTKVAFPIDEKPQITFEGSILCINTERYQITDVKKYTFSRNEEVSIQEVEEGNDSPNFRILEGEKIAVKAQDPSAAIHIYSSKGVEHAVNTETDANGYTVMDMAGLMPDVYVIAIGDETFKIRKR